MPRYRITQDRWCFCGRPAALLVVRGEVHVEYVCSLDHGEIAIEHLKRKDERESAAKQSGKEKGGKQPDDTKGAPEDPAR